MHGQWQRAHQLLLKLLLLGYRLPKDKQKRWFMKYPPACNNPSWKGAIFQLCRMPLLPHSCPEAPLPSASIMLCFGLPGRMHTHCGFFVQIQTYFLWSSCQTERANSLWATAFAGLWWMWEKWGWIGSYQERCRFMQLEGIHWWVVAMKCHCGRLIFFLFFFLTEEITLSNGKLINCPRCHIYNVPPLNFRGIFLLPLSRWRPLA